MSRDGAIQRPLGTQAFTFRLGLGQQQNLEERCGVGLVELLQRLHPFVTALRAAREQARASGQAPQGPTALLLKVMDAGMLGGWRARDVREVLYEALRGGGTDASTSTALLSSFVDTRPPMENALLAYEILMAWFMAGGEEPLPGEPKAPPRAARRRSPTASPDGPRSTA